MYLKLMRWLTGFDWFYQSHPDAKQRRQNEQPSLDYNDLAFQLAVANEISQTLPSILTALQSQLNVLLPKQNPVNLLVLFSSQNTSESWLHHSHETTLPNQLTQALHQQFTIRKTTEIQNLSLSLDGKIYPYISVPLFEHIDQSVWLFYLFDDTLPSLKQLKWKTASLENTLIKGLKAWCQTESKVRAALETERATYAAELHDSLAQILGYLKIKSAKLDKLCQQPPHQELKSITEDLATYTQCAYHQTRELIVSSRLTLQSDNLSQAVTNSLKEFEHQSAIVFELDNRLPSQPFTPKESMQILYIIRESLSNIVRHSHATHARVSLFMQQTTLQVHIEDNGSGIEPSLARSDSFGLQIMHERAERIGAELAIKQRNDGGTSVTLILQIGDKQ